LEALRTRNKKCLRISFTCRRSLQCYFSLLIEKRPASALSLSGGLLAEFAFETNLCPAILAGWLPLQRCNTNVELADLTVSSRSWLKVTAPSIAIGKNLTAKRASASIRIVIWSDVHTDIFLIVEWTDTCVLMFPTLTVDVVGWPWAEHCCSCKCG